MFFLQSKRRDRSQKENKEFICPVLYLYLIYAHLPLTRFFLTNPHRPHATCNNGQLQDIITNVAHVDLHNSKFTLMTNLPTPGIYIRDPRSMVEIDTLKKIEESKRSTPTTEQINRNQ